MFGQALPERVLAAAVAAAESAEVYLSIGSSLTVHPAASLPRLAAASGARLVVLLDDLAALVLREQIADVLPAAVDETLSRA